jgi:hypothetical protein
MEQRPALLNFDPDYCGKVAKIAACVCFCILFFEALILLLVDPSGTQCPGWVITSKGKEGASLWALVGIFTGFPAIWIGVIALRWKQWFAQHMYEKLAHRKFPATFGSPEKIDFVLLVNSNQLFLQVCIGWCLFCTAPLWTMVAKCRG